MKDFLGNTIHKGDRVITFSCYAGGSAHFVEATVVRLTDKRVWLEDFYTGDTPMAKELQWTIPNKCVVLLPRED